MQVDVDGITGTNNIGASALFIASRAGHIAVVEFLVAHGASTDKGKPNGVNPLYIASQNNYVEVVALLLGAGASVDLARDGGHTPLHVASQNNNIEVVTLLLGAGASADLAMDDGFTPLHAASQNNNIEAVTLLLGAGASVDLALKNGFTPLHAASQKNNIEVVTLLLGAGASVDLTMDDGTNPRYPMDGGHTPLLMASQRNNIEVMKHLLATGASMDLAVQGWTPLKIARHYKHTAAVELLEVWHHLTQLIIAARMRQEGKVWELLHSGEDPTLTVQYQQQTLSAITLATSNESTCSWAAPVCTDTLRLMERSLQWSPLDLDAHQLFPPEFRRGVRHILGLMMALEQGGRGLPHHVWMLIVAALPRKWGLTTN